MGYGKYTIGEVHALVGPIIEVDPDDLDFVVVIALHHGDSLTVKGPSETPHVIGSIVENLFQMQWNSDD